MANLLNLVQMSVSGTPGTGTITLGSAATGWLSMASAGAIDGGIYSYRVWEGPMDAPTAWEIGLGTYTASGTTLTRTEIRESSNAGAAVSFTSAAKVAIVALAEDYPGVTGFQASIPQASLYHCAQQSSNNSPVGIPANTLYIAPLWVTRRQTYTKLGLRVTTAGAAGKLVRCGLYTDHPIDGRAYKLLADSGDFAADTTGEKEATISLTLTPGLYWTAVLSDGAPTLQAGQLTVGSLGSAASGNSLIRQFTRSLTYGALSPDESGQTWSSVITNAFTVWLRN